MTMNNPLTAEDHRWLWYARPSPDPAEESFGHWTVVFVLSMTSVLTGHFHLLLCPIYACRSITMSCLLLECRWPLSSPLQWTSLHLFTGTCFPFLASQWTQCLLLLLLFWFLQWIKQIKTSFNNVCMFFYYSLLNRIMLSDFCQKHK